MKKFIIFLLGIMAGALFFGNGFYVITASEHSKAYIMNKYTRNVFKVTSYGVEKVENRK